MNEAVFYSLYFFFWGYTSTYMVTFWAKQLSLSPLRIGLYLPSKAHRPAIKDVQGLEKTEPETKFIYVRFNKSRTRVVWVITHMALAKVQHFLYPLESHESVPAAFQAKSSVAHKLLVKCKEERELEKSMLELLESNDD